MTTDNKTRQSQFKTRMREMGFQQMTIWVHKDAKAEVAAYDDSFNKLKGLYAKQKNA